MAGVENEKTVKEDFVDKYLAHLVQRDSREGTTKWLMMAAMAALLWQLSNVFFSSNFQRVGQLVGSFLALYFVVEFLGLVFSGSGETTRLRFRPKTGYKDASFITVIAARYVLTGVMFVFFFQEVPARWAVAAPTLFVGAVFLALTIGRLRQKYHVLKPAKKEVFAPILGMALFVLPVVIGLYHIFSATKIASLLLDPSNLKSIQASGLIVVVIFLAEKYAKTLRVDGEVFAVRRIWQRKGIGEISSEDAAKELRLVIAGASLSEVISKDVNAFSQRLQAVDEHEELAKQELERFTSLDGASEPLIKNALRNSLQKRAADISSLLTAIDSRRDEIMAEVRRIIDDDTFADSETKELEASLDERCKSKRTSAESLLKELEQAGVSIG